MGGRKRRNTCPSCGGEPGEPIKVWQLASPFPDSKGRITITVMGVFECKNCGYKWRGVVSKVKAGGSTVEIEGESGRKRIGGEEKEREGYVIEIDLDKLDEEDLE